MTQPALDLQVFVADGLLRLALTGELVNGTTARLRTWMQRHVPSTADRLVLDLRGLVAVDAVGLGALLAAHRRLAQGAEVRVDGASEEVARVLRRSGLDRVLQPLTPAPHVPQQASRDAASVPS